MWCLACIFSPYTMRQSRHYIIVLSTRQENNPLNHVIVYNSDRNTSAFMCDTCICTCVPVTRLIEGTVFSSSILRIMELLIQKTRPELDSAAAWTAPVQ